jgi:biopolymer transport protein TolQ
MGILLASSFMSWWYIFIKLFALKRAAANTQRFEKEFWSGADLNVVFKRISDSRDTAGELERVFEAGFREFLKLRRQAGDSVNVIMDGTRRAMRASYQREQDVLESHLSFLATVGSVSPYIGLFGTVWGIMLAFTSLASVAQATLAQVAPGIAEALIATAMGLFAAIPAVVAYNRFTHDIDRLSNRMESFMEEFSNILQRQIAKA